MTTNTRADPGALGIEAQLFRTADKLRGNMEPSDYKHVALGLIFLKHISDSFEAKHAELLAEYPEGAEDPDEYLAENVFWVPEGARWSSLQANAKQTDTGMSSTSSSIASSNSYRCRLMTTMCCIGIGVTPLARSSCRTRRSSYA